MSNRKPVRSSASRKPSRQKSSRPKQVQRNGVTPPARRTLASFRRVWNQLAEIDADLHDYCRQRDDVKHASGELPSQEYLAKRQSNQLKSDKLTNKIQAVLVRQLLHGKRATLVREEHTPASKERLSAIMILLVSSMLPELRTARLAQEVLLAAGRLAVLPPHWAVQKMDEVKAAVKSGGSLDQVFGLRAPKGKTTAVKASLTFGRNLALVLAVEQLREQSDMTLEVACDHIAMTTHQIGSKTLENIYCQFKRDGFIAVWPHLFGHLLPNHEAEVQAACRDLGRKLCERSSFPITFPPPMTTTERTCLKCEVKFTASDPFTRLCPTHR